MLQEKYCVLRADNKWRFHFAAKGRITRITLYLLSDVLVSRPYRPGQLGILNLMQDHVHMAQ